MLRVVRIIAVFIIAAGVIGSLSVSLNVVANQKEGEVLQDEYLRKIHQMGKEHSVQQDILKSNITMLMKELQHLKESKAFIEKEQDSNLLQEPKGTKDDLPRQGNTIQLLHPCTNNDYRPAKHRVAMFTFVTDMESSAPSARKDKRKTTKDKADYTYGAAALIKSIQHHVGEKADLILLEIPIRRIPEKDRSYLHQLGWNICTVTPIEAKHQPFGRFIDQFNKFHLWSFIEYEKIIYLDSDTLVVGNIDPLLERTLSPGKMIGVTRDYFGTRFVKTFNMGVFMIHPNMTEFHRLINLQANDEVKYDRPQAEQGFLNVVYADAWEEIGIEYNGNMAVWAQKPSAWPTNPRILHFTLEKPWQESPPQFRVKAHGNDSLDDFLKLWTDAARTYGVLWDEEGPSQIGSASSALAVKLENQPAQVIMNQKSQNDEHPKNAKVHAHSCINKDFVNSYNSAIFSLLIPKQEKYVAQARVLGASISLHTNETDKVILELSTSPISSVQWTQLQSAGWTHKCTVEPIKPRFKPSPRFTDQFAKLRIWGMTMYRVAVYLDGDTFVMGNIDELININLESPYKIGVTADFRVDYGKAGEWASSFNMGMFAIHPDWIEYQRLLELQAKGGIEKYEKIMAEQGWLNAVYKEQWKDVGFIYNANVAARFDERFKSRMDDIRIVHYTTMSPLYKQEGEDYKRLCQPWADLYHQIMG